MKINKNCTYLLLIVLVLIIAPYIYNTLNVKSTKENFTINSGSIDRNSRLSSGFNCINSMDGISRETADYLNNVLRDNMIPSFCNKYPDAKALLSSGARIINDITEITSRDVIPNLDTSHLKVRNLGDIISGPKYEYTILFKIKIDNRLGGNRNILHHGGHEKITYPSIFIKSNTNNLGMNISVNSPSDDDKLVPKMETVTLVENLTSSWHSVGIVISGKHIEVYLDGKINNSIVLQHRSIWTSKSEKIYVSSPWSETVGGFKLSEMIWFPFKLSKSFIWDLVHFKPEVITKQVSKDDENTTINDTESLTLMNNWSSYKGGDIKVSVINNIVFIDGIVTTGQINGVFGQLKDFLIPNRNIELLVGGSNGYYLMKILTNGTVYIFDNNYVKGGMGNYPTLGIFRENEKIYLSNIRYPLKGSTQFNIVNKSNDSKPLPTFTKMGNILFLSGVISDFAKSDNNQITFPDSTRIRNDSILSVYSGQKMISKININSEINKIINLNKELSTDISLEGKSLLTETYKFLELNLRGGFVNINGNKNRGIFCSGSVYKYGKLVALNGLLRRMNKKAGNIRFEQTEPRAKYSSENTEFKNNFGPRKALFCAQESSQKGFKYFHIDGDNNCYGDNNYNTSKPNWEKISELLAGVPNTIVTKDKITFTSSSDIVTNTASGLNNIGLNYTFLSNDYMEPNTELKSILNINELDGSKILTQDKYNSDLFPWQKIIKLINNYKLILLPKIASLNVWSNGLVALMPSYMREWDPRLGSNRKAYSYLSPNINTSDTKFIDLLNNMDYNKVMKSNETMNIAEDKYINLTNILPNLLKGSYKIVILKEVTDKYNNKKIIIDTRYKTIDTFDVKDGRYVNKVAPNTFRVKEQSELIAVLEPKYRPMDDMYFTTYAGSEWTLGMGMHPNKPDGQANIKITKSGAILLLDRLNIGNYRNISLAGITYLTN